MSLNVCFKKYFNVKIILKTCKDSKQLKLYSSSINDVLFTSTLTYLVLYTKTKQNPKLWNPKTDGSAVDYISVGNSVMLRLSLFSMVAILVPNSLRGLTGFTIVGNL